MHLFFDTVWKLHIGEIPEKPDIRKYGYGHLNPPQPTIAYLQDMDKYNEAIAAIKQNALTVGNPEIMLLVKNEGYCDFESDGNFYEWPGGYETKEKELWTSEREPASCFTTVTILTLPEEKKNTMEISEFKCMTCSTAITKGEYDTFGVCDACYDANYKKQTASGSAGNITKEQELTEAEKFLIKKSHEYPPFTHGGLNQLPYLFVSAVAKCMEEFVQFSLYKDHPTTSSGSVAAPKEESLQWPSKIELPNHSEKLESENTALREALKELLPIAQWGYDLLVPFDKKGMGREWPAIIERARKLLSK